MGMAQELETIHFHNAALQAGMTGTVDADNAVIKGVSLITGDLVADGHDLYVDGTTLKQLHTLGGKMKQVPVTLDHGAGITSINGFVDNFRLDGNKWRGDWHLLKTHKETETMLERAERQPGTFGMSVAFKGPPKGVMHMGKRCARAERLLSVDCVTRAAANPDGMFSAKDGPTVDISKKSMAEQQQQQAEEPTLKDVLAAIGKISQRQDQFEATLKGIVESNEQPTKVEDIDRDRLEQLYKATDAELKEAGLTRQEVNQAVQDYNDMVTEAEAAEAGDGKGGDGDGKGGDGEGKGGEGEGQPATAVGAGVEGSTAFKALAREVTELSAAIKADKDRLAQESEEVQFQALEGKMVTLSEQRDRAIELAEGVVAENEALRLAVRTGTRPVKPGVDNNVRLFSANDEGELHEFQQLVKTIQGKKDGRTEGEAILLAMKEPNGPALHADWLQKQSARTIHA